MASPATSSRPSSAVASKATNNDNNDPYRAQKPVAEIDVVLVLDASPGPERWGHQVWNYFRHLMEHLTARGQHVSRVRILVRPHAAKNCWASKPCGTNMHTPCH